MALPKLQYVANTMPITIDVIQDADKLISSFILESQKAKWNCSLQDLISPNFLEHFIETNLTDEDISVIPILELYLNEILWDNRFIQVPKNRKLKKK